MDDSIPTTLYVLDLRHELADAKDRLRRSIEMLDISRSLIQQLRGYAAALEDMCVWSETSWRSILAQVVPEWCQCCLTLATSKAPVLPKAESRGRSPTATAVASTTTTTTTPAATEGVLPAAYVARGPLRTPLPSCDWISAYYMDTVATLDAIHKQHLVECEIDMMEHAALSQHALHEVQRLKADVRVERYKQNQREAARDKQVTSALDAAYTFSWRCLEYVATSAELAQERNNAVVEQWVDCAAALVGCVTSGLLANEMDQRAAASDAAVQQHLDYMEHISYELQQMCMLAGTDAVLMQLESSDHRRGVQTSAAPRRDDWVTTTSMSSSYTQSTKAQHVEPSKLEALLLMSPGGD